MSCEDYTPEPETAPGMTLKIDLQYQADQIAGAVVERAAQLMLERLQSSVENDVRNLVRPVVEAKVNEIVAAALARRFTPVNGFGEPTGGPTTIGEILADKAETFLGDVVDVSTGRATSRNSYVTTCTRAEYVIKQLYEAEFNRKVEGQVKDLVKQAGEKARLSVAKAIVDSLAKEGVK